MHKQISNLLTPSSLFAHIYVIVVHELLGMPPESLLIRVLCENVRIVIFARNIHNLENSVLHLFSGEMIASLDMPRPLSQSFVVR